VVATPPGASARITSTLFVPDCNFRLTDSMEVALKRRVEFDATLVAPPSFPN
jgi:hypothetical protein